MSNERAFLVTEKTTGISGIAFAASAGRARMIAFRSSRDGGWRLKVPDFTVRRAPEYDHRWPQGYSGRFLSVEHMPASSEGSARRADTQQGDAL